ncbi:o-succinylbenzoate synthase [Lactococcus termiticola]|uniref:o-succinylbenzoate synthase n=1 Tax=Lactococcus termiticola TaxID=2169526 RepID=A0A2R5HIZ8_9LACT|nr:o-succinylbenzoate synthase [Lactococcus termiticola]GBG96428.1 L-alanine-DL-glutamate epimerase [Lactococcus termiticola]
MKISLYHIQLPMKFDFKTAKSEIKKRESIIIWAEEDGLVGCGECVAFTTPFYTAETLDSAWNVLCQDYIPKVLRLSHFNESSRLQDLLGSASPMALAGLENALLDLLYKKKGENLIAGYFGETPAEQISQGSVLGEMPLEELDEAISKLANSGVHRIKLKISPETDIASLGEILKNYPQLDFLADANQSFQDWKKLESLDQLGLHCIEEPLANPADYSMLKLQTPICFDESVQSLEDIKAMQQLVARPWLNIKIGRLGGLYQTREIIRYCRQEGLPFWIGSMVETGISKILHAGLSGLAGNVMPGDLSASKHYFEADLIEPDLHFEEGKMSLPKGPGIGVSVNEGLLEQVTIRKEQFSNEPH